MTAAPSENHDEFSLNSSKISPLPYDVLSGQGRSNQSHPGNIRYQDILKEAEEHFTATKSKDKKQMIAQDAISQVQRLGRFLRYDPMTRQWYLLTDDEVYAKVSQALRYRRRQKYGSSPDKDPARYPTLKQVLQKHRLDQFSVVRRSSDADGSASMEFAGFSETEADVSLTESAPYPLQILPADNLHQYLQMNEFPSIGQNLAGAPGVNPLLFRPMRESEHFTKEELLRVLQNSLDMPSIHDRQGGFTS